MDKTTADAVGLHYVMHVGICVCDLERAIHFYRDGLGFEEAGRLEVEGEPTATMLQVSPLELHAVYLERDGFRIELLHYPKPGTVGTTDARPMNEPGLTHFAIRVQDLESTIERIVAHGGSIIDASRVSNKSFGANLVYALDPDGTRLELVETANDPTRP